MLASSRERLFVAVLFLVLIGVAGCLWCQSPTKRDVAGIAPLWGAKRGEWHQLYTLDSTKVGLVGGDLLRAWSFQVPEDITRIDAIGVPAKLNLSPPFRSWSLDAQVRAKVTSEVPGGDLDEELGSAVKRWVAGDKQRDLRDQALDQGVWVQPLSTLQSNWKLPGENGRDAINVQMIAGISAVPPDGEEADLIRQRKPAILEAAAKLVCQKASEAGCNHLAIPLLGSGAAGVDRSRALDSLLAGINDAASQCMAPESVTIVLYPGPPVSEHSVRWDLPSPAVGESRQLDSASARIVLDEVEALAGKWIDGWPTVAIERTSRNNEYILANGTSPAATQVRVAVTERQGSLVTSIRVDLDSMSQDRKEQQAVEQAKWLDYLEVMRLTLAEDTVYDGRFRAWTYRRKMIWLAQLFAVSACAALATYVALLLPSRYISGEPGAWSSVKLVAKWGGLTAGFGLTNEALIGDVPNSPFMFAAISSGAFLWPLLTWLQLPPKDEPRVCRYPLALQSDEGTDG